MNAIFTKPLFAKPLNIYASLHPADCAGFFQYGAFSLQYRIPQQDIIIQLVCLSKALHILHAATLMTAEVAIAQHLPFSELLQYRLPFLQCITCCRQARLQCNVDRVTH